MSLRETARAIDLALAQDYLQQARDLARRTATLLAQLAIAASDLDLKTEIQLATDVRKLCDDVATRLGGHLARIEGTTPGPHLVSSPSPLNGDQLVTLYCRIMREISEVFVKYETYVVRVWDGMDGCWTDCTGEVSREEALRVWAERTGHGTRRVKYDEIDYYRIFPGGTHMHWDGSKGQEMHR